MTRLPTFAYSSIPRGFPTHGPRSVYRKPSRPMTLILGVVCNDGIVMACDSQITADNSKRTNATKLHPIRFGQIPVLVAEAGRRTHTSRYIQILKESAKGSNPKNEQEIAAVIQSAMDRFLDELRSTHGCASTALVKLLIKQGIDCVLLFGFQIGWKSSLAVMNIHDPVCRFVDSHFEAQGSGALLGDYLLKEHTTSKTPRHLVVATAVHIASVVKQYDIYCSGDTVIGVIQTPDSFDETKTTLPRVHFIPQKNVEEYARLMASVESKTREFRTNFLQRVFEHNEAEIWKELEAVEKGPTDLWDSKAGDEQSE